MLSLGPFLLPPALEAETVYFEVSHSKTFSQRASALGESSVPTHVKEDKPCQLLVSQFPSCMVLSCSLGATFLCL